jgi:hypothetical protein
VSTTTKSIIQAHEHVVILLAAQVAHEVNRAYCRGLGDFSQADWYNAPSWQRESAIAGVRFLLTNPNSPPSASHESWLRQKFEDGWVYGPVKDPDKKEHPCMVPFDDLPVSQQTKDILFTAAVRGVFAHKHLGGDR